MRLGFGFTRSARTLRAIWPSAASVLADHLDLPADPDDERWAHLLIEASIAAGRDRCDVLHDGADGKALVAAIAGRRDEIDAERCLGSPGSRRRW